MLKLHTHVHTRLLLFFYLEVILASTNCLGGTLKICDRANWKIDQVVGGFSRYETTRVAQKIKKLKQLE